MKKRILSLALACFLVLGLFPPMQLAWITTAADTVTVDTTPIYSDYVFDQLRKNYIYNTDTTSRTTVYASAAVLYKLEDHDAHVLWGTTYHPGDIENLRPSVTVQSSKGRSWYAEYERFDYRLSRHFDNPDLKMRFGGNFTTTKNNKPTMTVSGVTIGSDAGKNTTTRLEGIADPSTTIHFEGGKDTGISGAWAAMIDNATAVPVGNKITARLSGSFLSVDIPMDEPMRWANSSAGSYADQIYINVRLTDMTTGAEVPQDIKLSFDSLQKTYSTIDQYDILRFSGEVDSKWSDGHFSISRITGGSIPTVTDIPFEVYGMLGVKIHDQGSIVDDYGNAPKKIMDVKLTTTPITDLAGNKVDLSGLTNLNLTARGLEFDNLAPKLSRVYVTHADGIGDLQDSRDAGSSEQWPAEIDRSQLFLGDGRSMTFAAEINEIVLDKVAPASSGVTALLNVLDANGQQISLKLASTQILSMNQQEKFNRTKLVFEPFTAATGMTMMSGHEDGPIKILEFGGTIKDRSGNALTGTVSAPEEQLYLDVQAPQVTVQKLAGSDPNTLELVLTVSDKNGKINAGLLEQHHNSNDQNLQLWLTGNSGPQEMHYEYTLDTYPNTTAATRGSTVLSSQKSTGISYAMRATDEITLKLTLRFSEYDVSAAEDLILHVRVNDVVDNMRTGEYTLDYKLDQVPPELTLGAVQYKMDVSSATVTVPVNVTDTHSQVAKLEYRWSTDNDWTTANITQGKTVRYDIVKTYNDGNTHNDILEVRATDSSGQVSEIRSVEVFVDLQRPATAYSHETPSDSPQAKPVLIVAGPNSRHSDGADAYTRITVTMGDDTYVRVVKTGDSTQVFAFDGTWYRVETNSTQFTGVEAVADPSTLRSWYGPVTVTFENAFADLTPVQGAALAPTGVGYYTDPVQIRILYAPDQANAIHGISWDGYTDADSNLIDGEGAIHLNQTMGNTRIDFSLSNLIQEDWGISDIDFGASWLEFYTVDSDAVLIRRGLETAVSQSFFVPYQTDDALELPTGLYRLTVHIVKKDGRTDSYSASRDLVLDADQVHNEGLWKYTLRDGTMSGDAVSRTAQSQPFESFGMAMGVQQEIYRDDLFAHYTNGVSQMTITLAADENAITYDGITVGQVEGFRLWPMAANLTDVDLEQLAFQAPTGREEGQAQYTATFGTTLTDEAGYPQGTAGIPTPGGKLHLMKGTNVICYQVKMENGTVSPVRQFTIFVTEELPILEMSLDSFKRSVILSEIEGMTNVQNLVLKLDNAFSMNGSGDVTVTMRTGANTLVNNEACDWETEVLVNDLITLSEDSYTGEYTETLGSGTTTLFIARDEYGGTMVVAPQIGSEYRIGGSYPVDYDDYPTDYWTGTRYGIRYNEPQYDEEDNIVGYETQEFYDVKLGLDRTTTATLDYNRYAINSEVPKLSGAGYRNIGAYIWHSHDVAYGEYIDWSTVTLTLPTLDGGEVTLPIDYSGPNDAGYLWSEYEDSGKFVVCIANPVDDEKVGEDAFSYTTFQINCLDTVGNPLHFVGGYNLEYVPSQPTGSTSGTGYEMRTPTAAYSATPTDVRCIYNSYASNYYWEIATGLYNAGTYSGTYTDYYGKTHVFSHEMEAFEEGLDITVTPTTPTCGAVTVVLKSTLGENITIEEDRDGQTITGNGTPEVTVVLTENGSVVYETDTIYSRSVRVENIVDPSLEIRWSYDPEQLSVDENGTAYHYGPVTAWLVSSDDAVDVVDNYTGELPSYTFYPGEATSYTFPKADFSILVGNEPQDHDDFTVTLEVELRSFENPPMEEEFTDDIAPAVQLRAYSQRNGLFADTQQLLQAGPAHLMEGMTHRDGDTVYTVDSEYADTSEYISALGWASTFRFQLEMMDESKVKFFVKASLYAAAPDYETGTSDTIEGVSLNGRILEVSAPAAFTLFAVDEVGNVTTIPLSFTNLGQAPVPMIVKIPGGQVIYAYLLPPDGSAGEITDLKLTYPANAAQATEGEFAGYWYAPLDTNGIHTLNYSFIYNGELITGKLEVEVTELDTTPIALDQKGIVWSANKQQTLTNQDVSAQLWFTRNVSKVQVPADYVNDVEVLITGNRVTVRYDENVEQVMLTVVATNGTGINVPLDAVTNIDKEAPIVLDHQYILSDDGKSVTAHFLLNEQTVLTEQGTHGTDNGDGTYSHTWQISSNGNYTVRFTDLAANNTAYSDWVDEIVDTPLELRFRTDRDGTVEDPDGLKLVIGDTVHVMANRDCTMTMNGEQVREATANTWVEFTIAESEAGLWPIIHAVDAYGNTAAGQFGSVSLPDRTAPILALQERIVIADISWDADLIRAHLQGNLIVTDEDPNVTVTVQFTDNVNVAGTTAVTYTATDSAGNEATITGWLRISDGGEIEVSINSQYIERDSIYLCPANASDLEMLVYTNGQPFQVVWKPGVKTLGQMKSGTTELYRGMDYAAIELPADWEPGYYTICVKTLNRDEYRILVYVN